VAAQRKKAGGEPKPTLPYIRQRRDRDKLALQLQKEAEKGIACYDFERFSNGNGAVNIDGTRIALSPVLADFLSLLADPKSETPTVPVGGVPDPSDHPELVPWKTAAELANRMHRLRGAGKPAAKPPTAKRVWNWIWCLRKRFEDEKANPYLIQTTPHGQARLALQRRAAA
jgi:hypothetical protein